MLDGNAFLFIALQFGSRFANSFLVTAARYELLEEGGVAEFAGAQVVTNVARIVVSQIAGVLTDNFALKRLYVATEVVNLCLAVTMLVLGHGHTSVLFMLNVGLGLVFSFSQPVSKSMPPAVAAGEDLALINGWDLTCDKVGRYLAPMAYALLASRTGFRFAVLLSTGFYACLALLRFCVQVNDEAVPKKERDSSITVFQTLAKFVGQVKEGLLSLKRDRVLRLLILNTLLTQVFLYPVNQIGFPVLFKQLTESGEVDSSVFGSILTSALQLLGIQKKKAWMNYTALVSLGGVVGPFLSNLMMYAIEAYSHRHKDRNHLKVGVTFGMLGQILTTVLLAMILSASLALGVGLLACALVALWTAVIAVNNVVTSYFNSISQERLQRNERGRYIANLMTIFNLGGSAGALLFGWVMSGTERSISGPVNLLLFGLAIKVILLALVSSDASLEATGQPNGDSKKTK
eukprot:TRINITY_DN9048_c0_g1_i1.p1 TRINITY_DN9048_c0_g1~~TRINITY_DN9048_c0_g1_i1.p1  ORF type:complete len:461 (+),score=63.86 TRINITY_DN9048_c0_g1_i1:73-1455(+)